MAIIGVRQVGSGDPLEFAVEIREGRSATRHRVTMARATHEALGAGVEPATCIRAAFAFLLEREPKESILDQFDVTVISRYFPEFEDAFPGYLRKETVPPTH
jgi:hypothetical protein